MLDYQLWKIHRNLNEVNSMIEEFNHAILSESVLNIPRRLDVPQKPNRQQVESELPKLGYLLRSKNGKPGGQWFIDEERRKNPDPKFNPEKAGIRQCLVTTYKDEENVQRGGIAFPPGVVVNKINHVIFNYDDIQDKITELLNIGKVDCCTALNIRIALKDKMFTMGRDVVEMLKFPLKINKDITVSKEDVENTLIRFYKRDMTELQSERKKQDCGDCGGARSSFKRKTPNQLNANFRNVN